MSYTNDQKVDVRGITTTGLTSSTTLANHLSGVATAVLAVDGAGNASRVAEALRMLNELADVLRTLHL